MSSRAWERFPSGKTGVFKAKCVVTHPHLIKGEIFLFFLSLPPPDQHRTNRAITEGYDPCPNSCEMEQLTSPLHSHRTTPSATTPPTRRQPSRTEKKKEKYIYIFTSKRNNTILQETKHTKNK